MRLARPRRPAHQEVVVARPPRSRAPAGRAAGRARRPGRASAAERRGAQRRQRRRLGSSAQDVDRLVQRAGASTEMPGTWAASAAFCGAINSSRLPAQPPPSAIASAPLTGRSAPSSPSSATAATASTRSGGRLAGGCEHRQRDRQIEAGALLALLSRGEIHDQPRPGKPESRRGDAASHPLTRLLQRPVGQPDHPKRRQPRDRRAPRPRPGGRRGRPARTYGCGQPSARSLSRRPARCQSRAVPEGSGEGVAQVPDPQPVDADHVEAQLARRRDGARAASPPASPDGACLGSSTASSAAAAAIVAARLDLAHDQHPAADRNDVHLPAAHPQVSAQHAVTPQRATTTPPPVRRRRPSQPAISKSSCSYAIAAKERR